MKTKRNWKQVAGLAGLTRTASPDKGPARPEAVILSRGQPAI